MGGLILPMCLATGKEYFEKMKMMILASLRVVDLFSCSLLVPFFFSFFSLSLSFHHTVSGLIAK